MLFFIVLYFTYNTTEILRGIEGKYSINIILTLTKTTWVKQATKERS